MTMLVGVVALLVYYHLLQEDNPFELFMDSQAFGVKFLFAAVGTCITFFWTSFFQSKFIASSQSSVVGPLASNGDSLGP